MCGQMGFRWRKDMECRLGEYGLESTAKCGVPAALKAMEYDATGDWLCKTVDHRLVRCRLGRRHLVFNTLPPPMMELWFYMCVGNSRSVAQQMVM
jgi:hypothetical protein